MACSRTRVRLPPPPPSISFYGNDLPVSRSAVSKPVYGFGLIEEPDRPLDRRGTEVHVPLRRGEIHVTGELLNGSRRRAARREVRTERVPQSMYVALLKLRPQSPA
jgi:hypothetical protein